MLEGNGARHHQDPLQPWDGGHRLPSKNDDSEEEVTVRASGLRGCGTDARKAELAEPGAELTSEEGESQESRS